VIACEKDTTLFWIFSHHTNIIDCFTLWRWDFNMQVFLLIIIIIH